jgi:hypothetical protein
MQRFMGACRYDGDAQSICEEFYRIQGRPLIT